MTLLLNPRATVAITAALRALNTRTVGGVGFATAVAAIALTGAQHPLDDALATHPSLMSSIARGTLDALVASYAAPIVATIAATAAYLGRAPNQLSPSSTSMTVGYLTPISPLVPAAETSHDMSLTRNQLLGEFADAALLAVDTAAKPAIVAAISAGEVDAQAALTNLLKNLPRPNGIEGALVGPIEAAFAQAAESYAAAAVAKYGPDVIFALLDAQLHAWAKALGG